MRVSARRSPVVSPQLERLAVEYLEALDRLHALRRLVSADEWAYRTDPARWSVAECVAHLNLTSAAFLPPLRQGMTSAAALGTTSPVRPRHTFTGWLLWRMMGPPVRLRTRTPAAFVPEGLVGADTLVTEFERMQDGLMAIVREADGLPLGRVMIPSPFNSRVRYNLYSALAIVARHQHRHLWQAEQVWARHPG